jgi:glycolate oxidase FAD binding subunit
VRVLPEATASDTAAGELAERIRDAAAAQRPLRIRGAGTKDFYGRRVEGEVVDTRGLAGIVDYAPTELVVTARAGTPLTELEAALREAGQMLAFEPPQFGAGATLGGAVAAGLSGPRRPYAGAVRDFVLGVRVIDGTGTALRFGGRVMKNVAGFDVARLMTGALGTLGVLTEVSLKCLPRPQIETTCVRECSADESIRLANEWGGKPLPLSATCYHDGRLWVRLSGAGAAVTAARAVIGGDEVQDGEATVWTPVRDHAHRFFADLLQGASLWRLSVRSTAPFRDLGGEQLIEWGGALRWLVSADGTIAEPLRAFARAHGGHATCFRGAGSGAVFQPLAPPLLALHQRLKHVFDPHGILNRGRLYPEV